MQAGYYTLRDPLQVPTVPDFLSASLAAQYENVMSVMTTPEAVPLCMPSDDTTAASGNLVVDNRARKRVRRDRLLW